MLDLKSVILGASFCGGLACGHAADPPAMTPTVPSVPAPDAPGVVPISLEAFAFESTGALAQGGLSAEFASALPALHKLRNLERCVVKFEHYAYEEDIGFDQVFKREGHMILLGVHGDKVIGLTTRCAIDFTCPGYQYVDPGETDGQPDFVAGAIVLHSPEGASRGRRDYYFVRHETNWNNPLFSQPVGRFVSEFLAPLGLDAATWKSFFEGGDFVSFKPIGNNDLAFVVFENRKYFGINPAVAAGGLQVTAVTPDTVAFRAGLQVGDVLRTLNGTTVHSVADLDRAKEETPANREVKIEILRAGRPLDRFAVFHHPGNFVSQGVVETLGVGEPLDAVARLLKALGEVGDALQTRLVVHCQLCDERIKRAKVVAPPSLADSLLRLAPLAGALVGAENALRLARTAQGTQRVVNLYQDVRTIVERVGDVRRFLTEFPLGAPTILRPEQVTVLRGDTLEVAEPGRPARKIHLAYCTSKEPEGTGIVRQVLAMAQRARCLLVAVPDGKDLQGEQHCHVLVVRPEHLEKPDLAALAETLFEGYLSFVLVHRGVATATDFGVSDGRSTRVVLEALRKLDDLK